MPFIQRVVQPVNVAQVSAASATPNKASTRFQCIPGKCKNNNCINKQQQQQQQQHTTNNEHSSRTGNEVVKDTNTTTTNETTQALVHSPQHHLNGFNVDHAHNQSNGYAGNSFSYATDNDDNDTSLLAATSTSTSAANAVNGDSGGLLSITTGTAPVLGSMKKLKQHVEFLSTSPSHLRSNITASQSLPNSRQPSQQRQQQQQQQQQQSHQHQQQQALQRVVVSAPQSPTSGRIISGYEFDSISNITLSNALRQLASLVLIASDIFDELQQELQAVGERAGRVQRKITAVERRVCAYDPKMVTVPESDLLTFAQRKVHYETDKSFRTELFTADTRPRSVRQLYEDAAKVSPPPTVGSRARSPASPASATELVLNEDGLLVLDATSTGSDEHVCTPVFGKANRKMRTRIDAEIEIRLPAAIDDLRKWTSSEALGDVTVTPDCMHHVDTSISTSMVIGDNGILTPALSPSVLSADAVDAMYAINVSAAVDSTHHHHQLPNDINKDVPLNHRLPSPEEQTKIIALKYPAEVISVDTSGKRFQRMCAARKSTTGCYLSPSQASGSSATGGAATNGGDANNLCEDVQTVSRRSRSRKVRGKRRNTIAGIDQKEIQDAANGDSTNAEIKNTLTTAGGAAGAGAGGSGAGGNVTAGDVDAKREKSKKFGRSKSSDILKKETVALPYDKGKNTLTRLNSLKQWGRNRFKFMQRNELTVGEAVGIHDTSTSGCSSQNTSTEKADASHSSGSGAGGNAKKATLAKGAQVAASNGGDIDDECVVHALIQQKSEGRFSHERKPSYSSSEKSMSVSSSGHLRGKLHVAATVASGNVKMRDTASLNRQRRNGMSTTNGLVGKEEQPHSSSGNWSASSESGRASIGSEITIQPKSSASNTSLNVSSFHPGSGPPSSMMSRRRFLNTSASSSVTSEGTATPELQVVDGSYPNHLDDETSSAYSCDTEGYYTSFHMDSGLRTLKEEEPPMTPLQQSQNLHTSNYSFGSQSNQTVLNAENEYELFGRGSTSTTTSSAGTVCTTLMNGHGPDVPERISSLGKLNKGCHSNSASSSTLERSYSSSTIGSTLERTGTIKRNVNAGLKLTPATSESNAGEDASTQHTTTPESHEEEEFDYEQRLRKRTALPLPPNMTAEVECSESSDLEGVERIERIKQKTAINAKRIPSMCIITPTTSDDENQPATKDSEAYDPNRTLTNNESSPCSKAAARFEATLKKQQQQTTAMVGDATLTYCTVDVDCANETLVEEAPLTPTNKDHNLNVLKAAPVTPTKSLFGKLKVVLPHIKRSPSKSSPKPAAASVVDNDDLYDTAGEYVTIADISNNNRHNQLPQAPKAVGSSGLGIYYSNDIVRRRRLDSSRKADELTSHEAAKENRQPLEEQRHVREAEYVSLNELPQHLRRHGNIAGGSGGGGGGIDGSGVEITKRALSAATDSVQANACAEAQPERQLQSAATHSVKSSTVPMYAEISELREEKSLISPSGQQRGVRVLRPNAEGRIVYDSDSLKRRKGAHTTFAPGPYVKETESALNDMPSANVVVSHESAAEGSGTNTNTSESATNKSTPTTLTTTTTKSAGAKLLLLNGGIVANRKVANVRPIVSKSPLTRQNIEKSNVGGSGDNNNRNMPAYMDQTRGQFGGNSYQEHKNLLANHTNPFYQPTAATTATTTTQMPMMHSPSTKSNSSTGSTATNSSSSTSTTASAASGEEGYQHFSNIYEQLEQKPQPATAMDSNSMPFQRNAPIYWTLQSRRQSKPAPSSVTVCRDDLYATPIRRSERVARAAAAASTASTTQSNISPIVPRNRNAFLTSTPTRSGENSSLPADNIPAKQPSSIRNWEENNSPERLNTCADRIGHSKTSLMDFKRLLLAKSTKTNPVQRKLSAVEMLKKANTDAGAGNSVGAASAGGTVGNVALGKPTANSQNGGSINSSLKLLDLSGSPKTFANRRMLRQGQFGSPSKSFAPKLRANTTAVQRTDIMSTTIPEANSSEEDHSNTSGSNSSRASSVVSIEPAQTRNSIAETSYDLKRNFFLQTEENNFMRGELRKSFTKSGAVPPPQVAVAGTNLFASSGAETNTAVAPTAVRAPVASMPALETAL